MISVCTLRDHTTVKYFLQKRYRQKIGRCQTQLSLLLASHKPRPCLHNACLVPFNVICTVIFNNYCPCSIFSGMTRPVWEAALVIAGGNLELTGGLGTKPVWQKHKYTQAHKYTSTHTQSCSQNQDWRAFWTLHLRSTDRPTFIFIVRVIFRCNVSGSIWLAITLNINQVTLVVSLLCVLSSYFCKVVIFAVGRLLCWWIRSDGSSD